MAHATSLPLKGQVAIVTGAGNGLGRNHALALAKQGARVVVNDLGGSRDGQGKDASIAQAVCDQIIQNGGEAIPHVGSVTELTDVQSLIDVTMATWGRIDILVNNAGILRDKTFSKMSLSDFSEVINVHLMGTVNCCKLALPQMQEQEYGRIIVTTSSSGLYGNYGQTNYGAAKLALVGFMNSLGLETAKHNIHVNALSPIAQTRMTQDIIPSELDGLFDLDSVSNGLLALCGENAPNRKILAVGNQYYATAQVMESDGLNITNSVESAAQIHQLWHSLSAPYQRSSHASGPEQTLKFIHRGKRAKNT